MAAKINIIEGDVLVLRPNGTLETVKFDTIINEGDTVITNNGRISIVFDDGSVLSMAKNSEIVVESFNNTDDPNMVLEAAKGLFTFMSGEISKNDPDAMVINTPVATIGIRGTQFGLEVGQDGHTDIVLMEEADGFVGEVVVHTDSGLAVLNQANQLLSIDINGLMDDIKVINPVEFIIYWDDTLSILPTEGFNTNNYENVLDEEIYEAPEILNQFDTEAGEKSFDEDFVKVINDFHIEPNDILESSVQPIESNYFGTVPDYSRKVEEIKEDTTDDSFRVSAEPVASNTNDLVPEEIEPEPEPEPEEDKDKGHGNESNGKDKDNPGKGKDKETDDHNKGHGNDEDGTDEDNPGHGKNNDEDDAAEQFCTEFGIDYGPEIDLDNILPPEKEKSKKEGNIKEDDTYYDEVEGGYSTTCDGEIVIVGDI